MICSNLLSKISQEFKKYLRVLLSKECALALSFRHSELRIEKNVERNLNVKENTNFGRWDLIRKKPNYI